MTEKKRRTAEVTSPDLNAKRLSELYRLMPDLFDREGQLSEENIRQLVKQSNPRIFMSTVTYLKIL